MAALRGEKSFRTNFPEYLTVKLDNGRTLSLSSLNPTADTDGCTKYTVKLADLGAEKYTATVTHPSGATKSISGNRPTVSSGGGMSVTSQGTLLCIETDDINSVVVKVDGNVVSNSRLTYSSGKYTLDISGFGPGNHSANVTKGTNSITLNFKV